VDRNRPIGKIQKSSCYRKQLISQGYYAGFKGNVKVHNIWQEALVKADGICGLSLGY
jgi:hypothetical protein